jgi:hypothetical protein
MLMLRDLLSCCAGTQKWAQRTGGYVPGLARTAGDIAPSAQGQKEFDLRK